MSNKLDKLDLDHFIEEYRRAIADIQMAQVDRRNRVKVEGARLRELGEFPPLGVDSWKFKKEAK